jgi:glycosyltransferase involved in cell wall biosynthesis
MAGAADSFPATDRPVRFITVGDLRDEKGFPIVAAAIESLAHDPLFHRMEFFLHCNWSGRSAARPPEPERLKRLGAPNIHLIEMTMDETDYIRFLKSGDVLVLPYRQQSYRARTSGVLIEAMSLSKLVIVTDDTWMSDQTAAFGSGLTFPDGDVAALASAMRQCCLNLVSLQKRAIQAQSKVTDFHNANNCLQLILSTSGNK